MAYSVMINANGTDPDKYADGISAIINKVKPPGKENSLTAKKDLSEYTGYYSWIPWSAEIYFSSWEGKLVSLRLPSDNPGEAMTFYKNCLGGELTLQTIGESPLADQMPPQMQQGILHATLTKGALVLLASDMVAEEGLTRGNAVSLMLIF